MISLPFRRSSQSATIEDLYGMIVAQARSLSFYRDYGVPDTVTARFDMILLHLVLVFRRLRDAQGNVHPFGQQIFDLFCRDMDHNFREMGVGDLAVPKQMRQVAEAFYGRAAVYEAALVNEDEAALEEALARNVFGDPGLSLGTRRLAAYMRDAARQLIGEDPVRGSLQFPAPEATPVPKSIGGQVA